ncbi:MAG: hypothetical protein ABL876_18090 [Chitinophagaceae bacterium]
MGTSIIKYYRFLFYYIYKGYLNQGEKRVPGLYALFGVTVLISFNIISACIFFLIALKIDGSFINGYITVAVFVLFFLINYSYFYLGKGKETALKLFVNLNEGSIRKLKLFSLIYIIATAALLILALYLYINS